MKLSQPEIRPALPPKKLSLHSFSSAILCLGLALSVQAQQSQPGSADQSSTTTRENSIPNTNPSRITESHSKSGNRAVDTQRREVLGPDGRYQPSYDTETETIQVDANTTRTVIRGYRLNSDGRKTLVQVTEVESRTSASGDTHLTRTSSDSDVNGNLRITQREVSESKSTSPDTQETKTTVYRADGNGGFTPSLKTQEQQTRGADNRVDVKKTMLRPDGNGGWKVGEVRENTTKEDGKNRVTEQRISRPDANGRVSEIARTVTKDTENAAGDKSSTVETYSPNIPGVAGDGSLRLNQRVTTVQKKDSSTTEQLIEQPNPGELGSAPRVVSKTKYTVHYAASGAQQTQTTQQDRDPNGNFKQSSSSLETKTSNQTPAPSTPPRPAAPPAQPPPAPANPPKPQ